MKQVSKQVKEYSAAEILLQYSNLRNPDSCPQGVYVTPSRSDSHLWNCVIFLRRGPYSGGVFRFNIVFPLDFPSSIPQAFFPSTLFHPLVDSQTGRLSLLPRFPSGWKAREHTIPHLLYYIKSIFMERVLDDLREGLAFNPEVWRMYRENRTLFQKLASQSSTLSVSNNSLFDPAGGGAPQYQHNNGNGTSTTDNFSEDGINFRPMSKEELRSVRLELFQDEGDLIS